MAKLHVVTETTDLTSAQLNKIKKLTVGFNAQTVWHVLCHNRVVDRGYIDALKGLWSSYTEQTADKVKALEMQLLRHFNDVEVNIVFERNWGQMLEKAIDSKDYIAVIRGDNEHPLSTALATFINNTSHNVVVLGERPWGKTIKLLGTLDPFHDDDPEKLADKMVYHHTMQLKQRFKTNEWHMLHVIYVPPLALRYKSDIIDIHREGVIQLCRDMRCSTDHARFLEGLPEAVLRSYTKKQEIDLLIMGSRNHGMLDKWLDGSTIEALLKNTQLDVFVARQR